MKVFNGKRSSLGECFDGGVKRRGNSDRHKKEVKHWNKYGDDGRNQREGARVKSSSNATV